MVLDPKSTTYKYLYCDQEGEEIGLDEVQFEEPIPSRVPVLHELFDTANVYVKYQSALVLVAWNDGYVFASLEAYLDELARDEETLDQHRLYAADIALDNFAGALSIALINNAHAALVARFTRQLLQSFGIKYFRSGMERLLRKVASRELLGDIVAAFHRALASGRHFEASLLLPAITRVDPEQGWNLIKNTTWDPQATPSPMEPIAEALGLVRTEESNQYLQHLLNDTAPLVAEQAAKSIEQHSKQLPPSPPAN